MKTTIGNFLNQEQSSFPHDCELYAGIQENMFLVSILGNIAGDKVILYGCEPFEEGSKRNPGYVFLRTQDHPEGEVLFWEGDSVSRGMHLYKHAVTVSVEEKEYPEAYTERTLRPGIGEEMYKWSDFRDLTNVMDLLGELKAHEQLSEDTSALLHFQDNVLQENIDKAIDDLTNLFSQNLKAHEEEANTTFEALQQKDAVLELSIKDLENKLSGELEVHNQENQEQFGKLEEKLVENIKILNQELTGKLNKHAGENDEKFRDLTGKIEEDVKNLNEKLTGELNDHIRENNEKFDELRQKVEDETQGLDKKLSDKIDKHTADNNRDFEALNKKVEDEINTLNQELSGKLTTHTEENNTKFNALDTTIGNLDTRVSGQITTIQEKDTSQDESLNNLQTSLNSLSTDVSKIKEGTIIPKKAESAAKLDTARKITLTGDLTGETQFDGSQNVSIAASVLSAPKIVNSNKTNENNRTLSIWVGTQAEYNAITTKDENTLYNII